MEVDHATTVAGSAARGRHGAAVARRLRAAVDALEQILAGLATGVLALLVLVVVLAVAALCLVGVGVLLVPVDAPPGARGRRPRAGPGLPCGPGAAAGRTAAGLDPGRAPRPGGRPRAGVAGPARDVRGGHRPARPDPAAVGRAGRHLPALVPGHGPRAERRLRPRRRAGRRAAGRARRRGRSRWSSSSSVPRSPGCRARRPRRCWPRPTATCRGGSRSWSARARRPSTPTPPSCAGSNGRCTTARRTGSSPRTSSSAPPGARSSATRPRRTRCSRRRRRRPSRRCPSCAASSAASCPRCSTVGWPRPSTGWPPARPCRASSRSTSPSAAPPRWRPRRTSPSPRPSRTPGTAAHAWSGPAPVRTPASSYLRVADDGHGGADERAGTGLSGIRRRVEAHDGTFRLDSPVGGPTVLEVRLPCGS